MPFTDETHIAAALREDSVTALKGTDGAALTEAIAAADARITATTGVEPAATVSANHATLRNCAAWIAIWILTGRQSDVSETEVNRRHAQYDDAIETLNQIRDGDLTLSVPETTTPPSCGSAARRVVDF